MRTIRKTAAKILIFLAVVNFVLPLPPAIPSSGASRRQVRQGDRPAKKGTTGRTSAGSRQSLAGARQATLLDHRRWTKHGSTPYQTSVGRAQRLHLRRVAENRVENLSKRISPFAIHTANVDVAKIVLASAATGRPGRADSALGRCIGLSRLIL